MNKKDNNESLWKNISNKYSDRWSSNLGFLTSTKKPGINNKYIQYDRSNWYTNKNSWSLQNFRNKNISRLKPHYIKNWGNRAQAHRDRRDIFDHFEGFSSL